MQVGQEQVDPAALRIVLLQIAPGPDNSGPGVKKNGPAVDFKKKRGRVASIAPGAFSGNGMAAAHTIKSQRHLIFHSEKSFNTL